MDTTILLTVSFSMIAALFGVLCGVIGWVGHRMALSIEDNNKKIDALKDEVVTKINTVSLRLVKVESKVGLNR